MGGGVPPWVVSTGIAHIYISTGFDIETKIDDNMVLHIHTPNNKNNLEKAFFLSGPLFSPEQS